MHFSLFLQDLALFHYFYKIFTRNHLRSICTVFSSDYRVSHLLRIITTMASNLFRRLKTLARVLDEEALGVVLDGLAAASFQTFKDVKWSDDQADAIDRAFERCTLCSSEKLQRSAARVSARWMPVIRSSKHHRDNSPEGGKREKKERKEKKKDVCKQRDELRPRMLRLK